MAPGVLERHERVVERRRLGVLRDGLDLGELQREPGLERLAERLDGDLVERRDAAVRPGPRGQQRIAVGDRGEPADLGDRGIARRRRWCRRRGLRGGRGGRRRWIAGGGGRGRGPRSTAARGEGEREGEPEDERR
jgi:hypothetical protein